MDQAENFPTKVTRATFENAASVYGMLLTTECVITEVKKTNQPCQWAVECRE
uniref:Uncharacterized protein n=1 Tax=Chryseobacterium endophyticum TaxID=1854762 RepID=A0AAU6WNN1_9FLAO